MKLNCMPAHAPAIVGSIDKASSKYVLRSTRFASGTAASIGRARADCATWSLRKPVAAWDPWCLQVIHRSATRNEPKDVGKTNRNCHKFQRSRNPHAGCKDVAC